MRDIWLRMEAVVKATAPDLFELLSSVAPASARDIAAAEECLDFRLPEDVRASYAVRNGSNEAGILPQCAYGSSVTGVDLLSLEEMVRDWQRWNSYHFDASDDDRARPQGPSAYGGTGTGYRSPGMAAETTCASISTQRPAVRRGKSFRSVTSLGR